MSALEGARAARDKFDSAEMKWDDSPVALRNALDALIAEHEALCSRHDENVGAIDRLLAERAERLTAPPTDDEREALEKVIKANDGRILALKQVHETADAILAAGFRRQGPITDEWAPDPRTLRWAADHISRTEPTYGNATAFITPYIPGAAKELRERAAALEAALWPRPSDKE